ncbi:TIGR01212 family radical SAM protein [Shewanella xiamenensis]|uniref:TIGR01212 family radical SAM protein n=1 Tax=Shewanella xiamenensis TaxID=332186 RepID=A0AAW6QT57_9GAMM|nr:TIGR01212 family radical SAM protein [Shewanella xiamenensis]MDG5898545.1 TIGR01212 family radical SAM protein [Shewanella xiamenensis]MDH1315920.1 TIGR01212 family radical SAM protein [Shewanella xiamenensis]MDI5836699.1 TIGR01212 family radical SAM protein [Shewanella xiamenensis]MDI5840156.1 TIGR01212 family radical SAM protein [Shewanella xiamenensis]MDI5844041.1 TIGR01212 family radical SAM protein [Shewanella xiamenensis]
MGLDAYVNTFGAVCKAKYGERLRKLTIDAKFTCPNRDGTLGRGGCTFCNVASFSYQQTETLSISEQLQQGKARYKEAKPKLNADKFIAYFQAYTSTYDEYQVLMAKYDEAVKDSEIVGLCVGTRPDCVPDNVLDLLASYQQKGVDVWLELGLQTANDKTLHKINRGHDFACYCDTVLRARSRGLKVCTHLILGLPGETRLDYMATLQAVLTQGVDGLKLHPLHVVEGSTMAKAWRAGRLPLLSIEEYAACVGELVRHTPKEVIFHRVTAYAKKPILLAPDWCGYRWNGLVAIVEDLASKGGQGAALARP